MSCTAKHYLLLAELSHSALHGNKNHDKVVDMYVANMYLVNFNVFL